MRICAPVVWLVPLVLLSGSLGPDSLLSAEEDAAPARADIERDLVLEATLATPKAIRPGEPVRLKARVVNRSEAHTRKLVRPGDGSESGWREPHVFLRAVHVAPDGVRTQMAPRGIGRCGLHDADWHKGVTSLEPGAALEIGDWLPAPDQMFHFQRGGTVELRVHYRYTRGAGSKRPGPDESPKGTGPMGNSPAFELISAPLRVSVQPLVEIRLEVTGALKAGTTGRLADVLRLHVESLVTDPILVSGAEIYVQPAPRGPGVPTFKTRKHIEPTVERKSPPLAGKVTRTWSGRPDWRELLDWELHPTTKGRFQVVATWSPSGGSARYVSEPVEVRVLPR